jgi:hypothetical protein
LKSTALTGPALRDYLAKDEKAHREIMTAAGFLAKN